MQQDSSHFVERKRYVGSMSNVGPVEIDRGRPSGELEM